MQTAFDISGTVKRVTFYIGPTHVATLNRIIPPPGAAHGRYRYLLLFFRRVQNETGSEEEPCLIISSETFQGAHDLVLGVYDDTGQDILREERGNWADLDMFERKALSLAGERLVTSFVERPPRGGRDS
jgi:hypothetical protein